MSYKRINMEERKEISIRYNFEDKNSVKIGEELGRAPSTISREITRGLTAIKVHGKKKLVYDPTKAELNFQKEKLKRTRNLKIEYHDIWEPIKKYLEIRWSPEQISKEIIKELDIQVSPKTIYNYIHFHMKGELKKLALEDLRRKGKKPKSSNTRDGRGTLVNMTLI